uniref:Uncharacterized protein n=1 Tax=Leptospirillum ferrodiazotrophum TaxID=412449 RepID=C6HW47_9BACT|nr:MAG: protein of unknown function [Leptospirillum ferrodiazotrophum]
MMTEKNFKIPLFGHDVEVVEVPILNSTEGFNDYELGDGSKIRLKIVATSILRLVGQFNADGDPIYIVKNGQVVTVLQAPEALRRKV